MNNTFFHFSIFPPEIQLMIIDCMSNVDKYCLKMTSTYWLDILHNVRMDDGIRIETALRKYPQTNTDTTKFSDYLKNHLWAFETNFAIDSDKHNIARIAMGVNNYEKYYSHEENIYKFEYDCGKDPSNIKCAFCGNKYGDSVEPHQLEMMVHLYMADDYYINGDYEFRKKFINGIGWDVFKGNTFMIDDKPIHILQFIIAKLRYRYGA